ncbi:MAG TPA: Gfo/Idh/MocA family oxidoreductase [Spirochaetia bacterium]|nr:Gfo/Idh/MocA family oxidoreductase [Spirochaetia bacterium]
MVDNQVRCAVVGCGRISAQHIAGFLRAPGASIAALCDVSEARARELAAAHGLTGAEIFSDYRAMFSRVHPDIVSIAVPDGEHPAVVAAAVEAGAHVLCEKPLASTPAAAGIMTRMIEKRGLQNGVRMPYRFTAAYRYVHRWIASGALGRPLHVRAHLSVGRLSDPSIPMEWRMRRETGGTGALSDLGSHLIDLAYFLLPEWTAEISSVEGVARIFHPERVDSQTGRMTQVTTPDAVVCAISFASGCLLNLEVSRVAPGEHFFQVDGSEGSVRCNSERVWVYRRELTEHQRPEAEFLPVPAGELAPLTEPGLFEEFVRCSRTRGAKFNPGFAEAARVVHTNAQIYRALRKEGTLR